MRAEAIPDQTARVRALTVTESFIVQAPAGSGKTELLTQRYLRLLACVDAPEEIIAITFTRKAAGEMRARIIAALERAADATPPERPHQRDTWMLARAARALDIEKEWQLTAHPARLRIQTIDSLNAELTRQMPLLSKFGAQPGIAARPETLYAEAARRSLALLENRDAAQAEPVATLLQHLDNNLPRVQELLAKMLPQRDQWLRHTGAGGSEQRRAELEAGFAREIESQLQAASAAIPARFHGELAELASFAGRALAAQEQDSPLRACADLGEFPPASVSALPFWKGMVELLLTHSKGETWRKEVNKKLGFDKQYPAEKARMLELLSVLSADATLHALLRRVRALPLPRFDDRQWDMLDALLTLLPLTAAQLQVAFAELGQVDYAEVALRALAALGTPEAPTDLTLALDYRIRHLLVDEFQDTSMNQFALLERLTAGWEQDDGRTLFLVGDPMQSIYRFREAQVGLFLRAQTQGIGTVRLTPLTLSANFRAQRGLVEWVNGSFLNLFPSQADVASGAVTYSPAVAQQAVLDGAAVEVHPFFYKNPEQEAETAVALIQRARAANLRTAVLVRGRAQLGALVPRLRRLGVHFRATELETLGQRPVVRDLMALTSALAHPADRTAWLAILRAPWCGMELKDLQALVGDDPRALVPQLLEDETGCARLSAPGQKRLARLRDVLRQARTERGRGTLREQVEQVWLQLAGPSTATSLEDLEDAEAFLALLEEFDAGGALSAGEELSAALAELFARPDPQADDSLQLMTIHKAKGLEFDVVIVPGLGFAPRHSERPLLMYLERTRSGGGADLLLAPLNAQGSDKDPLYELVLALRKEQESFEQQRLLYVAATRARQRLHLLGHSTFKEVEGKRVLQPPRSGSLLAVLWPVVKSEFERALAAYTAPVNAGASAASVQVLRRLPSDWQAPTPPAPLAWVGGELPVAETAPEVEFVWAGDTLRHVGSVVHRLLQRIATEGLAQWDAARLQTVRRSIGRLLRQAGVPAVELETATGMVLDALVRTLQDATGRLILSQQDDNAHCEYALSGFVGSRLVSGVIDRSFVDNEGVRWIVDYKTSRHEGGDLEGFLRREEERYRSQLRRYVQLMHLHEDRPVKAGLYFPLLGRFHAADMTQLDGHDREP